MKRGDRTGSGAAPPARARTLVPMMVAATAGLTLGAIPVPHSLETVRAAAGCLAFLAGLILLRFFRAGLPEPAEDAETPPTQEALDRRTRLLALLPDRHPGPILSLDRYGTIHLANRAAHELFGKDILAGSSLALFLHHIADFDLERIITHRATAAFVERVDWRDYHFVLQGCPGVGTVHVYGADVTEFRRGEAKERERGEDVEALFEGVPEAIVTCDSRGRVTGWNAQAESLFGWKREEAVGWSLSETIVPERYREQHKRGMRRYLATGQSKLVGRPLEVPAIDKAGKELAVEMTITPLRCGDRLGFGAMFRDLSSHQRIQVELQKARDEAVASAQMQSEFLTNVSRHVRTPMNGVIGMTGLLLDTPLDDEQREYAEAARSSAESLLAIINDILDFSETGAGPMELEDEEFSILEVVEQTVGVVSKTARRKGIQIGCLVHAETPRRVRGDPERLGQVLTQLVANAVRHTPEGEVTVQGGVVEENEEGLLVRFEVTDTGIGIPQHKLEEIFEPFRKAGENERERTETSGLGLTITRSLVEAMGGAVGAESEEGRGSTFWFTVWLRRSDAAPPPSRARERLQGVRVLCVDDSETNRTILRSQLGGWGMVVTCVDSADRAMASLQEALDKGMPFELAVVDLFMPGETGADLARCVRSHPDLKRMPLLLLTASSREDLKQCAYEFGFEAALAKPASQAELRVAILRLLGEDVTADEPVAAPPSRVLLAEDNAVGQRFCVHFLQKLGHDVEVASNGRAVLEALARRPYDIVLMDCEMPELDGYEAAKAIRTMERSTSNHVPIVAITASALPGDRQRCIDAGMDDYLTKPIDTGKLETVLARWLQPRETKEAREPEGLPAPS